MLLPITNIKFQIVVIAVTFLAPLILFLLPKKWIDKIRFVFPFLYVLVILYLTILGRKHHVLRTPNLIPFMTYLSFDNKSIRWQVYMNIFLFIPLGFLIPFLSKKSFLQTLLIGCCLSITIEAWQYIFALGLCETDDVIHNTLGCIIGYWYWFNLSKFGKKLHRDKE